MGYARVSTDDQSLEMQVEALKKAGVKEDNIHVDKRSGVLKNRAGLGLALKDLRPGDTLVIWKLDRLSRDPKQVYDLLEYLKNKGCKILSLTEGFDSSTAVGQFFIGVVVAVAAFERALTVERTKAGIAAIKEKRAKGEEWAWGRKPLLKEPQVVRAGEMLNKGMTGPKVAAKFEVSTPTIYQHWERNPKWKPSAPPAVPKWRRKTKPR